MDIVCPITHERFSSADVNILYYRLDNCPLVPVPPHGDLIDRDALERHTVTEWFCGRKRVNVPWKAVSDAPTIIPAEPVNNSYKLEGEG